MSNSEDRRQRDLDLLMKSYKALEAEQADGGDPDQQPAPTPAYRPAEPDRGSGGADGGDGSDEEVIMYRGRPIRKGSGATPGAGSSQAKGRQFRGSTGEKKKKPATADQLKAALIKLGELHKEGLITQAEYDKKRLQILDRL